MSDAAPDRHALIRTAVDPAPLADVVEAVAVAITDEPRLYVERRGDRYRWSFVHAGGPYPLLRVTARFLGVDHTTITIGFVTIAGQSILCRDPGQWTDPDDWAVVEFPEGSTPAAIEAAIVEAVVG